MGVPGLRLAAAALLLAAADGALAYSTGIAGYSGSSSNCTSCHTGTNNTYAGYTALVNGVSSGTTVIQGVNTNSSVTVSTSHTGSNAVLAGLDVSVTSGTLTAGTGTRITTAGVDGIDGELTHSAAQTLSGAFNASWTFTFNPGGSTSNVTLYVCVNPVDGDGVGTGDAGDGPADCRTHTFDVNSQPVIGAIANQTINEDGNTGALAFTISDAETATTSMTPTGSSSNTILVPNANIVFGGSGANRTVTVTPAANQSGSATITVSLSDGSGGSDTETFTLTVNAVNDTPTVSNVANQTINEDGNTGALAVTVSDVETAAGSLTMSGSSSNTTLVPNANIVFGGSGSARTVTVTPAANQSGTATITVNASDGIATGSDTFTLTVNAVNDTPTVSDVANQTINEDGNTGALAVTVGDVETAAGSLTMSGSSSNTTLVPNANIVFGGSGSARTVTVTPAANQNGSATITVNASDGVATGSDTFTLTVSAVNDAPVAVNDTESAAKNSSGNSFSPLANDTDVDSGDTKTITLVGTPSAGGSVSIVGAGPNNTLSYSPATNYSGTETISYTMRDSAMATSVATITVTVGTGVAPVAVDDTATVTEDSTGNAINPLANDTDADVGDTREIVAVGTPSNGGSVSIVGSGPNNTLSYAPAANFAGTETFTYTVRDAGLLTDVGTVTVTVTAVNDTPTISNITDRTISEDGNTGAVAFTIGDVETAAASLTVSGSSSNTTLVPNANITFGGSGASRTVTVTPAANQNGTATITVTVSDGSASAPDAFVLTVSAVNDTPTISDITNRTIGEDANTGAVAFTIGDVETAAASLTVSGSSSNTTLVPNSNIVFGGSGASRTVTVTPAADQNGSATITVSVSDGVATGTDSFVLTVSAANDAPVIAAIPDQAAIDNALFSYTVAVTDVDGETSFGFDLIGAPAGMAIDSGGTITWTPPIGTSGVFTPTVEATDGSSATHTRQFQLTVSAPDTDSDGMPDSFENLHGLDPNDASDAAEDADGDGVSNLDEYLGDTDPTVDDIAPSVTAPADLVVPATGYLTVVDLGAPSAIDGLDGALSATSDLASTALRPGRHTVTWSATDAAGNEGTDTQQIDVLPLANFNIDQSADGVSGSATVTVTLNGTAPEYPATIAYTVDNDLGGLSDGTFTIASGTSASLPVTFTGGAIGTVTLTMSDASQAVIGPRDTHTITVTNGNIAPIVELVAAQGAYPRFVAYQDDGAMTLFADMFDPNPNLFTYDWSGSADALGIDGETGAVAGFSGVAPGTYPVVVTVSDGVTETTATLLVVVVAGSSTDVDVDADGIFDSVDSVLDDPALLENQAGDPSTARLLETEPGLALRRGRTSLAAGRTGALITMGDLVGAGIGEGGLPLGADSYENVGGLFDFEVHGVGAGGSASVVLPLQTAIRDGSVYRKFDPAAGWHDFVVDTGNRVASAFSTLGHCPGPASDAYVDGLQPFADCVRLTLTDGGPNDADGVADGVIRDPGGVAFVGTTDEEPAVSVSSGAFLALWLPLAMLLRLRRRAGLALLALAAVLAVAPAHAEHHVRIHYGGDVASGFDSNVTNAQEDADIRESGFASATGNVDYQRALSLYTTLLLRGSVQGEYWNSFDGLNNGKGTAMARVLYRGDGDFWTPTFAGWVSASVLEFDSAIRDSNEYRAGAFVTENLTTQITGRFALGASRREADGLVYDLSGYSASLNFDWVPAPRTVVYTGYQYYVGDVASTASAASFWIVEAADAIEADDAFGGLAGGLLAYRLDARAQVATLGFNYAFSRKLSADVQGQYISTRATARIDYERMVGVVSLLARF